jgi:hypothetical protein
MLNMLYYYFDNKKQKLTTEPLGSAVTKPRRFASPGGSICGPNSSAVVFGCLPSQSRTQDLVLGGEIVLSAPFGRVPRWATARPENLLHMGSS